ncbi:complement C3-like [Clupea harengus]|uniref:Complement C3-like n=1 Tax=Clupea harengus TaxID=7950 RepID=A0A6P8F1N6_CLUHA|nr:complement C3-like [Clupea harengus]
MDLLVVWLATVALCLPSLTQCNPLYVMSAPNLLRVGGPEKVFVEAQDYTGNAFDVTVTVKDYPRRARDLAHTTVHLSPDNDNQALAVITIQTGNGVFVEDDTLNQYVYLQAQFPGHLLERVVLVSFQSGYIFVQTDKTIYTPSSTVLYRIYALGLSLKPSEEPITVDVMNPEGIVVHQEALTPHKGICSGEYKVPTFSSTGTWKIVTRFRSTPQRNLSYDFDVEHYVLPRIEVTLTPQKPYFYIDDEELIVNISARYMDRMDVTGVGFVVFAVQGVGTDTRQVGSIQRVKIKGGRGHAVLERDHLRQTVPDTTDIFQLTGASLSVNVTVLTQTGHEMSEANIGGIQIVTSPYTIHFHRTPKYFKPGMPFTCLISVANPDGSPAGGVQVEVAEGKASAVSGLTESNGLVKLTVNTDTKDTALLISVKTKDPGLTDARQARQSMTALSYETKGGSKNYLHIGVDATELAKGDQIKVNLNVGGSPGEQNQDFTCLILNKGQLVRAERIKRQGQTLVSLSLPVTKDMVPSFRIVAYYHVGSSEVVSDSVWVDVKDTCMGTVKVEVSHHMYSPHQPFSLKITGDPGARVGLVAVDKGVYVLNNKHRLTQSKIWDVVERFDTGCTAGSGRDSMGVFSDAGLVFESSTAGGTDTRTAPHCPSHERRQRSLKGDLEGRFDDVVSRSNFQESFLWYVEQLPTCGDGDKHCTSASISKNGFVTGAITSWAISAISLSEDSGICVANSLDIGSTKHFSLDLKVPYYSKCNEQLEILAILHNHDDDDIKVVPILLATKNCGLTTVLYQVFLKLVETRRICSLATDRAGYLTTVDVRARTARAVPFVIVPMETGKQTIEVMAVSDNFRHIDGVRRDINVLPVGVLRNRVLNLDLNPSNSGGILTSVIGPELTAVYDRIPNMPVHHLITAQAHRLITQMEPVLREGSLAPLLRQPGLGGGEQDLITLTTALIATYYLDRTQQRMEKRAEAMRTINMGYQKLLTYQKQDGSYSVFKTTRSSTWLTAYMAKVFSMARGIISTDGNVICRALLWLAVNTQNPDGSFRELSPVPYTVSSTGNVYGKDKDASMTAFVLIAMQESSSVPCTEKRISNSIMRALDYLVLRIYTMTNPYAVAMVSYALANAGLLRKDVLLSHASAAGFNWPVPGNHLFTLEATANALLALVKAREFEKAGPIVKWLNKQQKHGGGYGSTQATLMVYQALAEYTAQGRQQQMGSSLEVTLNMAERTKPLVWTFTRANDLVQRSVKVSLDQNMTVTARGNGRGSLSVMTMYYSLPRSQEEACRKFRLDVSFQKLPQGSHEGASEIHLLTIDVSFLSKDGSSTTAILNIGILTGYVLDKEDMKKLSTGNTQEMDAKSPSQGNIVMYLNEISNRTPERITVRMHRVVNVGLLQPAGVSVREYNSREECSKFYHPLKPDGALGLICQQQVCKCAEESCGVQMKQVTENVSRNDVACRQFRDHVYKVTVEAVHLSSWVDTYHMRVKQVVKQGTDRVTEEDLCQFLSLPQCREGLDLIEGRTYLIIGSLANLMRAHERYQYVLSKHTWIEYWPTDSEGKTPEFRSKYMAIQQFAEELRKIGCQL